jgi:hypothetical protein
LGGRDRWIFEFQASLVFRASSRTARATQRNPDSGKEENPGGRGEEKSFYFFFFFFFFSNKQTFDGLRTFIQSSNKDPLGDEIIQAGK